MREKRGIGGYLTIVDDPKEPALVTCEAPRAFVAPFLIGLGG
ncbi:hypothetical protein ACIBCM_15610 [Streptomyces sp. NPDC051018]